MLCCRTEMMIARRQALIIFSEFRSENNGKFMKAGLRQIDKKLTTINEEQPILKLLYPNPLYMSSIMQNINRFVFHSKRSITCVKSTFPRFIERTRTLNAQKQNDFNLIHSLRKYVEKSQSTLIMHNNDVFTFELFKLVHIIDKNISSLN